MALQFSPCCKECHCLQLHSWLISQMYPPKPSVLPRSLLKETASLWKQSQLLPLHAVSAVNTHTTLLCHFAVPWEEGQGKSSPDLFCVTMPQASLFSHSGTKQAGVGRGYEPQRAVATAWCRSHLFEWQGNDTRWILPFCITISITFCLVPCVMFRSWASCIQCHLRVKALLGFFELKTDSVLFKEVAESFRPQ